MTGPTTTSGSAWRRSLLPAALLEAPGARRSVRDWVVDLVLFGGVLLVGALVVAQTWGAHSPLERGVDIGLGLVSLGLFWIRRAHPVGVAVLTLIASFLSGLAGGVALIAVFNAAIRAERRFLPPIVALALASAVVYPLLYPDARTAYATEVLVGVLLLIVAVGWGLYVRVQRDYVAALRERATRLQAEQSLRVEAAREAERRRIAGEMHDVLAHRVSLLSVHAGALEFRPDASPEEISAAAGVIRASAHAALQELRAVVGVLRDDDRDDATAPPQPTIAEVPALVAESQAAGMRVRLRTQVLDGAALPEPVGRTAYRVVQEGLTNARKHAPGAEVAVALGTREDGALVVEVVSRPAVAAVPVAALPGAGTGLVGLTERVVLAGGSLAHGPDAAGDFVLRAVLPEAS